MSFAMSKATVGGYLTAEPERKDAGGKALARFTIAVNTGTKDKQETLFLDCTAWEKTAELVLEHFGKGKPILVDGRLRQENWEKDGQKRSKVSLVVERLYFLPRSEGDAAPAAKKADRAPAGAQADSEDDLPF